MKIIKKELEGNIWIMRCPLCGEVHASADEADYLPESTRCDCDQGKFRIYEENGKQFIERLIYPRFRGEIIFGVASDIENIEWFDDCANYMDLARVMGEAGSFIANNDNEK